MVNIYLSGGFKSGWQKIFKEHIKEMNIIDPSTHNLRKTSEYSTWDFLGIKKCDIVFAYLEKTNPLAYGLILELGYAKALGKTIILVDEKSTQSKENKNALKMVQETADVVFSDFPEAIKYLKKFFLV